MAHGRFDLTGPVPALADLGTVHLIAIGGAGMSALARVLLGRGVTVTGSDAADSPTLRDLQAQGADVHVGHDPAYLGRADTVVVSSAVRENNVELRAARERGLRVLHRAQALAATMAGRLPVAVAGANGKTTTSSMLAVALQHCGLDPSFAIGGELTGQGTNARAGAGEAFVVEADESDGSFVVYHPQVAVVTSVQPDHLDFFGSLEALETAYRAFVATVRTGGLLVTGVDDPGARRLADWATQQGVRVVGYGTGPRAQVRLLDPVYDGMRSAAQLVSGPTRRRLALAVPGEHNLLDATAAFVAAVEGLGAPPDLVLDGLASFEGTRRRLEPKGRSRGVEVIDDYAHNPGKVAAAVATARRLVAGRGRLVVVFQPHLFSRTRDFAAELGRALCPADVVVVMDVYAAREDPIPGVSGDLVAAGVRSARPECDVVFEPSWPAVAARVARLVAPGDLVLTVGAGDVTAVGPQVLALLGEGQPPS
ncbi:MAG: UDP-N-acetylmuramate--L-alanine ligase [Dermatophilaceae bacterium]